MLEKKKVLYITYDGLTDPLGRSQIIPYLVGIAFAGYEVTILSCEKRSAYRSKKKTVKKILKLSNIKWKKRFYTKKPPVVSTLWDLYSMKVKADALHAKHNFHIIHCRSILGAWVGRKLRGEHTKLVFDIRGFWADERVEGGLWDLNSKVYKRVFQYFKNLEVQLFNESDHIVTLTKKAKKLILKKHSRLKAADISVIPCSVEMLSFDPKNIDQDKASEKKKLLGILPHDFILGYVGSFGTRYMAREMLQFYAELKKTVPNAKLLLISNGGEESVLQHAAEMGVDNSVLVYKADYAEMPLLISLFDAAVYFIKTGLSGAAVSPTKQAEILAMGKPIVSNRGIGDSDVLFEKYQCGTLLEDFSASSIQAAVDELKLLLHKDAEEFRKVAEAELSAKSAVEKYLALYQQLD